MSDDGLVTILRVSRPLDAQLARARLESEGIEVFIPDEQTATIDPLLIDAIGGVRVQVRLSQAARAKAILDEPPSEEEDDAALLEEGPFCPACESPYVFKSGVTRSSLTCQKCDHTWSAADAPTPRPRRLTTYRERGTTRREEQPVFRLRRSSPIVGLFVGSALGLLVELAAGTGGIVLTLGAVAGFFFGRGYTKDYCSDPDCRTPLRAKMKKCPGCAGQIHWVILRAPDHHAARAAWLRGEGSDGQPRELGPGPRSG